MFRPSIHITRHIDHSAEDGVRIWRQSRKTTLQQSKISEHWVELVQQSSVIQKFLKSVSEFLLPHPHISSDKLALA